MRRLHQLVCPLRRNLPQSNQSVEVHRIRLRDQQGIYRTGHREGRERCASADQRVRIW